MDRIVKDQTVHQPGRPITVEGHGHQIHFLHPEPVAGEVVKTGRCSLLVRAGCRLSQMGEIHLHRYMPLHRRNLTGDFRHHAPGGDHFPRFQQVVVASDQFPGTAVGNPSAEHGEGVAAGL